MRGPGRNGQGLKASIANCGAMEWTFADMVARGRFLLVGLGPKTSTIGCDGG